MEKPNKWLREDELITKLNFGGDRYYLLSLCNEIHKFLVKAPVHIISNWDSDSNNSIKFKIGSNRFSLVVNDTIAPFDYVHLIDRWARKFYPQYSCLVEKRRALTSDEIAEKLRNDSSLNIESLLDSTKIEEEVEQGIIEKIYLTSDQFRYTVNGVKKVCISGTLTNPLPLSQLLKTVRTLTNDKEIKQYIDSNSKILNNDYTLKPLCLTYKGEVLLNFFKIHAPDLYDKPITFHTGKSVFTLKDNTPIVYETGYYNWGGFNFEFNSDHLKDKCFNILDNYKKSNKIKEVN